MIGFSSSIFGQASATSEATATIITPISIVKNIAMNFGNVAVQTGTGGTVVLVPAGTRTATGGCTLPSTVGTVTAASYSIAGQGSYTYAITLPLDGVVSVGDGATHTMAVNTFSSTPSGTGTLSVGGTQTLTVGATLVVAAAQVSGVYTATAGNGSGAFTVTVNYN